jgi:hypothetical protein
MELGNRFIAPGILFLLTLAFGFWLSHAGKPYNRLLFNIHKLIALGGVVLVILHLTKNPNLLTPFSLVALGLGLVTLSVIALFVSRALMSTGKLDYALMLTIHRIAPGALAICCALALYLLARKP